MPASPGWSTHSKRSTWSTWCRSTAPASRPSSPSPTGCPDASPPARWAPPSSSRRPTSARLHPDTTEEATTMSEQPQLFSANLAKDAVYKAGLRSFMEYRDLGIEAATHGQFRAHVIRIKKGSDTHELHTTGLHQHKCDFQMFY